MDHDLRAALAGALPAAGPSRAVLKSMDDTGYKADPKNNDMKELFVALNIAAGNKALSSDKSGKAASGDGDKAGGSPNENEGRAQGPSASQLLLEYRREKKAAQEAMDREAAEGSAERAGKGVKRSLDASEKGVGLAYAVGLGEKDIGEAAENEHLLRRAHQSKTAGKMSSKQKRRRKLEKSHGTEYEERYEGKVMNKNKRKARMLAMKQMW